MNLAVLGLLLCVAYFTCHDTSKFHLCYGMYPNLIPLMADMTEYTYTYIYMYVRVYMISNVLHFAILATRGHLSCFCLFAVVDTSPMDIGVQMYIGVPSSVLLGIYLGVGLLCMELGCLTF
jgi:hypothetical protein